MKKGKKIIAFLGILGCFLTICLPMLLFPIRYQIFSAQMAKLSQMPVNHEEVILLQMSAQEFLNVEWTKPNKEFILDGEMYDIHSIQNEGAIKKVFVVHDSKESKIRKNLFKQTSAKLALASFGLFFEDIQQNFHGLIDYQIADIISVQDFYFSYFFSCIEKPPKAKFKFV